MFSQFMSRNLSTLKTRTIKPPSSSSHFRIPRALFRRPLSSTAPRPANYVRFRGVDPQRPFDVGKWDRSTKVLATLVFGGGVYVVSHLERVPETGRWRFMDVNPKYETALAAASREELMREFKGKILPPDHLLTKHIRRVVTQLLQANNLGSLRSSGPLTQGSGHDPNSFSYSEDIAPGVGGREWELIVVNDDKIANAATTYGNIVVFTGILPIAKDEQGLAAVLGHEIGHTVARHHSERYSTAKIFIAIPWVLEILGFDFGISRLLATLFLDLPNSRAQEYEADEIGLTITAKACYDPRAALDMFTRLGKLEEAMGRSKANFLYTHPTSEKRVQRLEELLPKAYAAQDASSECNSLKDSFSSFRGVFASGFP